MYPATNLLWITARASEEVEAEASSSKCLPRLANPSRHIALLVNTDQGLGYGLTECSPGVAHQFQHDEAQVGTVGRILPGT